MIVSGVVVELEYVYISVNGVSNLYEQVYVCPFCRITSMCATVVPLLLLLLLLMT